MSPTLALQSPVFLFYAALAAGLLVLAGAVLSVLKWGLRKNVGHAWRAYCGWLFLVPILLFVFFLGREAGIVFVTLVAVFGFVMAYVWFKVSDLITPLRVSKETEIEGLDGPEMGVLGYPDFQLHPSGVGLSTVGVAAASTAAELHGRKVVAEQN